VLCRWPATLAQRPDWIICSDFLPWEDVAAELGLR
jgi:hypothetical protein